MSSSSTSGAAPRVAIVTLGCGRNEVDSDQLAGLVRLDGMDVVEDADEADVVLVNTCTFIAPAKQESVDTVLAACDLKDDGSGSGGRAKAVLVVGCMAQRYPQDLADSIPEADAILGFDAYPKLPTIIRDVLDGKPVERVQAGAAHPGARPSDAAGAPADGQPQPVAPTSQPRRALPLLVMPTSDEEAPPEAPAVERVTTAQDDLDRMPASGPRFPVRAFAGPDDPRHKPWAYLKIASGCDRVCTFCAIPGFRGRFRSRPIDELVAEASFLADNGARELVLVSENTTSYGKDLGGRDQQPRLLEALADVAGIERIRLMYLQPAELQVPLLDAMASIEKVVPYFDLSLQHASADVLKRMARSGSVERFLTLVGEIRDRVPDAAFRSNFILGFPGEAEEDVAQLVDFLERARLDWVGLFPFSVEDGTPSATYDDQVPEDVAMERIDHVSRIQELIADEAAARFVGRELDVLVDEVDPDVGALGRSWREAPDTDGEVRLVDGNGDPIEVPVGRLVPTRIIAAEGVDLVGVPQVEAGHTLAAAGAGSRDA